MGGDIKDIVEDTLDNMSDYNMNNMTLCPDNTTSCYTDYKSFMRAMGIVVPVLFGLIVLVGGVGNLLVIIVVWSNKQMRNTTNILIVSLAIADLLFLTFCAPFTAANYSTQMWPIGMVGCKFTQYVSYVSAYASVYTLVLMSFDRYLAVVHAIRSMTLRTERNAYILIAVLWMLILVFNYRVPVEFSVLEYTHVGVERSSCVDIRHINNTYQATVFYTSFFAFGYALPLFLICVLYGFLLKRLFCGMMPGAHSQSSESIRSKKRVAKMVIIVVAAFALCWLPIHVMFIIQHVFHQTGSPVYLVLNIAFNCLAYTNSCINPILYAFLSENFRKSFLKVLCCGRTPAAARYDGGDRSNMTAAKAMELTALNNANHTTTSSVMPTCIGHSVVNNLQNDEDEEM